MTYEEAIYINKYAFLVDACGNTGKDMIEANKMAIEALEKAEKYKWHDLRKNPDDLPDTWTEIIFETSSEHYIGEMRENKEFYSNADEYDYGFEKSCIYRWRYYKTFEEVET